MATMISFLSAIILVVGIIIVLDLTPESMTKDIVVLLEYEESLSVKADEARGNSSYRKLTKEINAIRHALVVMGKERQFALICTAALALFVSGMIIALLIDNWFLAPVLSISFTFIPVIYVKSSMSHFEKMMNEELETALSIITTSYVRNDDIVAAIRENIGYIRPPVKNMMISFINQASVISADTKSAIYDLKEASNNYIFREWCDALISCQDDRTQKTTLLPIVSKFTEVRQVNQELETLVYSPRSEYLTMVLLVVLNYPLIFALNKDWFMVLIDSVPGKIVTAVIALVVVVTAALMFKYTKPIEYKK